MSDETPGAGHNAQPPREGSAPRPSIRFPQVAGAQYYITTQSQPRAIPALSQIPIVGSSNITATHTSNASGAILTSIPRIITISPSSSRALQQQQQQSLSSSGENRPSLVNRSIVSALTGRAHPAVRTQLFAGNAAGQQQVAIGGGANATIIGSPHTQAQIQRHQITITNPSQTPSPIATPRSSPLKRTLPQFTTTPTASSTSIGPIAAKRQRVLNHRIVKSKLLREKYNEHLLEQYYATAGGQILDLHQFAKRQRTQQYLSYMREHAIDPKEYDLELHPSVTASVQHPAVSSPSVSTPITLLTTNTSTPLITITPAPITTTSVKSTISTILSTTTPLSTTQSHTAPPTAIQVSSLPGITANSNLNGRHLVVNTSVDSTAGGCGGNIGLSVSGSGAINRVGNDRTSTPLQLAQAPISSGNQHEQIVEKAKQEAYVVQRISDLQKEGLWPEKRLPKIQEMPRAKAHWDYLLEEMVWLAADFAQERKWKKAAAKKCARMVQKYFQDKAVAAQKAEKAQEQHLRRVAAFCAREIRNFWTNVEKLVEYKQNTRLEEKRKKALDQHLSFIVDQTEKYSQLLAEGMNKPATESTVIPVSTASSNPVSRVNSDDEFQPSDENSTDDEETIAQEEAATDQSDDRKDEIEALQRESQMDFEAFLSELPKDYLQNRDKIYLIDVEEEDDIDVTKEVAWEESSKKLRTTFSSSSSNRMNEKRRTKIDIDFTADSDSADDEDTIREQEAIENPDEHDEELYDLDVESHLTVEELREKYSNLPDLQLSDSEENASNENSSVASDYDNSEDLSEQDESDVYVTSDDDSGQSDSEGDKEEVGLKSLLEDDGRDDDDLINDAAAIAESIQPKGNTLSSTSVVTKIPFLLKFALREYQHIGLDWLVTMFERKLNGILADEMGLGKTIQTIALLAHLACEKENWGPHLIVVPTSVMLNWEMECKKWCPGFKILTYYGSQKERKQKRTGWTKANAFHICITSYKLVIQDHQSFRRKKWKYLILDEAQNIKNFKSQRWQLLLNFQTQQRLLLTGTPLQNNLMELWSLMHFLMPNVFQSHREFKEWFSNPVTGMIEGNNEYNENIIKRLHKVLRPFLLRRLKCEVEKQMPKKYEHVVMCRLSKRQRFLYDDYMSRAKTKETLATGNLLSVINVLMQLRKVCNHPNLFEVRPTISPFHCEGIIQHYPSLIYAMLDPSYKYAIDITTSNYNIARLERTYSAYQCYRLQQYQTPRRLIEEVCRANEPSTTSTTVSESSSRILPRLLDAEPYLPPCRLALHVHQQLHRIKSEPVDPSEESLKNPNVDTKIEPVKVQSLKLNNPIADSSNSKMIKLDALATHGYAQVIETSNGKHILLQSTSTVSTSNLNEPATVLTPIGQKVTILPKIGTSHRSTKANLKVEMSTLPTPLLTDSDDISRLDIDQIEIDSRTSVGTRFIDKLYSKQRPQTAAGIAAPRGSGKDSLDVRWRHEHTTQSERRSSGSYRGNRSTRSASYRSSSGDLKAHSGETHHHSHHHHSSSHSRHHSSSNRHHYSSTTSSNQHTDVRTKIDLIHRVNTNRCRATPIYGSDLLEATRMIDTPLRSNTTSAINGSYSSMLGYLVNKEVYRWCHGLNECINAQKIISGVEYTDGLKEMVGTGYIGRIANMTDIFNRFIVYVPAAHAPEPELQVWHPPVSKYWGEKRDKRFLVKELFEPTTLLHPIASAMVTQFPHPRLIQYDCGKLQTLNRLLRKLKAGGHRALIFTQMTKMLDVLEAFLNFHGHIYLRLDGTTKVDQRQMLMERFNGDKRIFVFILSTRSGGVGVNLTGADTVIFYDSDWNPTMDAQAQDRCHRIGQTRDVHIYRLVSERTIEENILKKANQKRLLGDLAIEGGNFTTAYFKSSTIQDLFTVDQSTTSTASSRMSDLLQRQQEVSRDIIDPITTSIIEDHPETTSMESPAVSSNDKTAIGALESALAAAEDDQDVIAARTAKAEAVADLAEFDENIPLEEVMKEKDGAIGDGRDQAIEISKAEMEVENIVKQLTPIERYAMKFIEDTEAVWSQAQLEAAEREIDTQKREWEENRLAAMREEAERRAKEVEEEQRDQLTFPREDAINQVSNKPRNGKTNAAATKKIVVARKNNKLSTNSRKNVNSPRINIKTPIQQSSSGKKLVRINHNVSVIGRRRRIVRRILTTHDERNTLPKQVMNDNKSNKIVESLVSVEETKKYTKNHSCTENRITLSDAKIDCEESSKLVKKNSQTQDSKMPVDYPKIEDDKVFSNKDDKKPIIKKSVKVVNDDKRRCGKKISFSEHVETQGILRKSIIPQDPNFKKTNESFSLVDDDTRKLYQKSLIDDDNKNIDRKNVPEEIQSNTKKRHKKYVVDEYVRRSTRKLHIIDDDPILSNLKLRSVIIEDESASNSEVAAVTAEDEDKNESTAASYDHHSYDSSPSDDSTNNSPKRFLFKVQQPRISPRTRSRGTIAINLWNLDVSPILPEDKVKIDGHEFNSESDNDTRVHEDNIGILETELVQLSKNSNKKNNGKIKESIDALPPRRGRSKQISPLRLLPPENSKEIHIERDWDEKKALENSLNTHSDSDLSIDDFNSLVGTNVSCTVALKTVNYDDDFDNLIGTNVTCYIKHGIHESATQPPQNNTITIDFESNDNDIDSDLKDCEKKDITCNRIGHRHGIRLKKKTLSPKFNRYHTVKTPTGLRRPLIKARISPKGNIIRRSKTCKVVMEDIVTSGVLENYVQSNLSISVKRRIAIRSRKKFSHNNSKEKVNTLDGWLNSNSSNDTIHDKTCNNLNEIKLTPKRHTPDSEIHSGTDDNDSVVASNSSSNYNEKNGNDSLDEPLANSIAICPQDNLVLDV